MQHNDRAPIKEENYYEILGVAKDAPLGEIKSQYRRLALKYHPDRVDANQQVAANEAFKKISEAHSVLSDAAKRAYYDRILRFTNRSSSSADSKSSYTTEAHAGPSVPLTKKAINGLIQVVKLSTQLSKSRDGFIKLCFSDVKAADILCKEWNKGYESEPHLYRFKLTRCGDVCVACVESAVEIQLEFLNADTMLSILKEHYIISCNIVEEKAPSGMPTPAPKASSEPAKNTESSSSTPHTQFTTTRANIDGLSKITKTNEDANIKRDGFVNLVFANRLQAKNFADKWNAQYSEACHFRLVGLAVTVIASIDQAQFKNKQAPACDIIIAELQKYFDIDKFIEVKAATSAPVKPTAAFTSSKPTTTFFASTSSGNFVSNSIPGLQRVVKLDTPPNSDDGFLELDFGNDKAKAQAFCDEWQKHSANFLFHFVLRAGTCVAIKHFAFWEKNQYSLNVEKKSITEVMLDKLQLKFSVSGNIIQEINAAKRTKPS